MDMDTETQDIETPEVVDGTPTDVPTQDADRGDHQRADGEDRPTRRDRRQQRIDADNWRREAEEHKRTLDSERQERQRLAEQVAELRGYVSANQRQQEDPTDKQIADLEEKADAHLANAASTKDPAVAKREMAEYNRAIRQAAVLDAKRGMQADFQAQLGQFRQGMPDPEMAGMKVSLSSEFPWLSSNEKAREAADGYIAVLRAQGKPDNLSTYREACLMAARDHRLGGSVAPSNGQRARYGGLPSGEGAGGGEASAGSIQWDDHFQKLAQAANPRLDAEGAKAAWLKNVGPKYIAAMKNSR